MYNEAIQSCNEVLEVDENNMDALCDRAEAKISNQMFEEGKKSYINLWYFSINQFFPLSYFCYLQNYAVIVAVNIIV